MSNDDILWIGLPNASALEPVKDIEFEICIGLGGSLVLGGCAEYLYDVLLGIGGEALLAFGFRHSSNKYNEL
jgi:hypothetical protein